MVDRAASSLTSFTFCISGSSIYFSIDFRCLASKYLVLRTLGILVKKSQNHTLSDSTASTETMKQEIKSKSAFNTLNKKVTYSVVSWDTLEFNFANLVSFGYLISARNLCNTTKLKVPKVFHLRQLLRHFYL